MLDDTHVHTRARVKAKIAKKVAGLTGKDKKKILTWAAVAMLIWVLTPIETLLGTFLGGPIGLTLATPIDDIVVLVLDLLFTAIVGILIPTSEDQ